MIEDLAVRQQALDASSSFIIQAPAGSGKTELLIQRFLVLLTKVTNPEEIIALTFTNKAALEMKHRILQALQDAVNNKTIESEHQQLTRNLALDVLKQDEIHQWHLLQNRHRLHIQTLDAFCLQVCQNQPKDTLLPLNIAPADNPLPIYQQAIQNLLLNSQDKQTQQRLKRLLIHCDNNYPTIERMLSQLLQLRDQWLPLIMPFYHDPNLLKQNCEQVLNNIYQNTIKTTLECLANYDLDLIWQSVSFSYQQIHHEDLVNTNLQLTTNTDHKKYWLWLCKLLLTDKNTWRSKNSINKRLGFSTDFKEQKLVCQTMLLDLQAMDSQAELLNQLKQIRLLPDLTYTEKDWQLLLDCLLCLPDLVAETNILFQSLNQCDFTEITLAACRVLAMESDSDKAIYLDQHLSHILVDECQDTSLTQNYLLNLLTQNWRVEDDKTLFFVGDPMQSIYRFRQAEVTLFHQWQTKGLGDIPLTPLTLTANFRSHNKIVEWFNQQFIELFPSSVQTNIGGIPYSQAQGILENQSNTNIKGLLIENMSDDFQAKIIIEDIQHILKQNNQATIAILLQKRSQAIAIIEALKSNQLAFEAIDIEPLLNHTAVLDWLMCLRCLCDFNDKVAWFALMRSPICGLTLTEIFEVNASQTNNPLLMDSILNSALYQNHTALQHIVHTFLNVINNHMDIYLCQQMQYLWTQLGFTDYYGSNIQPIINQCQTILKNNRWRRNDFDLDVLSDELGRTYCDNQQTANVQLMTIHKSKGLEFDHVILPNLNNRAMTDAHSLIAWQHIITEQQAQFCVAPLPSPDLADKSSSIYQFCRDIEKLKLLEERKRLLYVAVTRAKQSLTLLAEAKFKDDQLQNPIKNTFAAMLWPWLSEHADIIHNVDIDLAQAQDQHLLIQPTKQWFEQRASVTLNPANSLSKTKPTTFADLIHQQKQMDTGIELHQFCYDLGTFGFDSAQTLSFLNQHENYQTLYEQLKQDSKAEWIFKHHPQAESEYTMLQKTAYGFHKFIVDRTFIDDHTRWIIDFKSATVKNLSQTSAFLQTQKALHFNQLQQYAKCFADLESNIPIRCALYFPHQQLWVEWSFNSLTEPAESDCIDL